MKIAILGFAREGHSAYEYWGGSENELTICDQNEALKVPPGTQSQLGQAYLKNLDKFDLLVRTPNLHPRDIANANPTSHNILRKVTSVTNEFFRVCPSRHIIGVTGTKGKGTTATLIAEMLKMLGLRVHLGGNIGIPALELLKEAIQPEDYVVLELSNFQLIDLHYSPPIALCLMIAPEHLNWHPNLEEYIATKQQLFAHQTSSDLAIYFAENVDSKRVASAGLGKKIPYYAAPGAMLTNGAISIDGQEICTVDEIQLLGTHNWQNVCAAITVAWQVKPDASALQKAIRAFQGLPHRLEYVREVNGVRYFNDSYASVPDATSAALAAISQPKIMIMGGFDRGLDLSELASSCVQHGATIKKIILIGASATRLAEALQTRGFHEYEALSNTQMLEIVQRAQSLAVHGDAVVLSPGFPSFDMFKDFEERGVQYKEAVNRL